MATQQHPPTWRSLARVVSQPSAARAVWSVPRLDWDCGIAWDGPSPRHGMAACGGGCSNDGEVALLFGGNDSRSVAGRWRASDELLRVSLPAESLEAVSVEAMTPVQGTLWPNSRWGATLTALHSARYLWGGWSHDGDASSMWSLYLRESCAQWAEISRPGLAPPPAAFHTSTALEDGRRMLVLGGLGDMRSSRGIWMFDASDESWRLIVDDGPSCAGHAAGVFGQRLVVFGGVERAAGVLGSDEFHQVVSVFDLRMNRWDTSWRTSGRGPAARRNPACSSFGKHLLVSGGFDENLGGPLADTWLLDVPKQTWHELPVLGTPLLEGHKAVVSGFDVFVFGGHHGPGAYPAQEMSVHALSIGL